MTAPPPCGQFTQEVTPYEELPGRTPGPPSTVCLREDEQRPRHPDDNLRPLQKQSPPQTDTKHSSEEEKWRRAFVSDTSCSGREVL